MAGLDPAIFCETSKKKMPASSAGMMRFIWQRLG